MDSTRITPVNDVIYTDFDGKEGILVDLNTKQYYRLNETGSLIWRGLDRGFTVAEIVTEIQNAYEVSSDHARASIEKLLATLETNRLVKRS